MNKRIISNNIVFENVARIIAKGEQVILRTKGKSMFPFIIGDRDSVELSPVKINEIKRGDILLAHVDNRSRYVIHRVISVEGERLTLMGDGNVVAKEECERRDVIAIVSMIIKPEKKVNPYSSQQIRYSRIWNMLHPVRRYVLAIKRRL